MDNVRRLVGDEETLLKWATRGTLWRDSLQNMENAQGSEIKDNDQSSDVSTWTEKVCK